MSLRALFVKSLTISSSVHPFFVKPTQSSATSKPYIKKTIQASIDTPTIELLSTTTTKVAPAKNISSKSSSDATTYPSYSHKDYSPRATVVYTQHEDEANNLVGALRGYDMVLIPFALLNLSPRPLGFDLEWRPQFVRGAQERRTALVQLSDETMILLIHVSSMKSGFVQSIISSAVQMLWQNFPRKLR